MEKIKKFVIDYIERKGKIPENACLDTFNYVRSGHIDSVGMFKFVVEIEAEFDIEISNEDLLTQRFSTIGGLISLISEKIG